MKINLTIDGQVIYSPDNDPPSNQIIPESDPLCYAQQCMCVDKSGRPDPFCPYYRKLHDQKIPEGVVIA